MTTPADATPSHLRVEYEKSPTNVDPSRPPRFSWRIETARRGAAQRAYRLVVGRDFEAVAGGDGTLWDSERVDSDRATNVVYDGPDLAADRTYYWSVKVWTDRGETEWAEPESFSTALRPEDWSGEWIAHQPGVGDTDGWRSQWHRPEEDAAEWVQLDLGESRPVDEITLHPADPISVVRTPDDVAVTIHWSSNPLAGFGFPETYGIELSDDPDFAESTVVAERRMPDQGESTTDGLPTDLATPPQTHDGLDAGGRYLRITATDLFEFVPSMRRDAADSRKTEGVHPWQCFALAGVSVRDGEGTDLTGDASVQVSSSVETATWGREHLLNGHTDSRLASTSPQVRREFELEKPVERARAHVAAVGYGELAINGEKVGDRVLDPAWTEYEKRVLYSTDDVTEQLTEGDNAVGLWLGRGWFAKRGAYWVADGSPRARAVLTVEFTDGTTRRISTDGDWAARESPIVENDIYDGETYDARREADGWRQPDFDASGWDGAEVVDSPGGTLRPERIEPMEVVETFDVEAVHEHPDGPILDFGQNLTGWLEVEIEDPAAGDEITLRHAETLTDDGDLATVDLRSADATDTYVARGAERETYEPRFTYHGFRYAQVEGYPGELDPEAVTATVVHTAMDRRGEFACSNDDLNQVQHNAVWGLAGNAHSIPEDCPQRDERFGWTGDAQIAARSLAFNFDAARFHEKWARDHDDAASDLGYAPDVIPNKAPENPGDPTWTITRVVIPWHRYRHDGDERILEEQFEGMREHVEYWLSVTENDLVPGAYGKFGDWLAFENTNGRRGLPYDLFTTAFVYQITDILSKIADVLDNDGDAARYREWADRLRTAFNEEFFEPAAGRYRPGTQASYAVPLFLGLVPEDHVETVAAGLAEKVRSDGGKLKTGFLGTRPLIQTLAEHGYDDLAYEVVSQPERPGWLYMARNGATTMWERWNSDEIIGSGMNSLNHSPLTHVSEYFYEVLAGIKIGDRPVTDHVTIAPSLVEDLKWVEASYETRNGELAVDWERTDGGYDLSVRVPWNTSATIRLPDAAGRSVSESGVDLAVETTPTREGVRSIDYEDDAVVLAVDAGEFDLSVR